MKYYQCGLVWTIAWIVVGLLWVYLAIIQVQMLNYYGAVLALILALINLLNAYTYRKAYVELGEGKIVVHRGWLVKRVIRLADVTSLDQEGKKLIVTYRTGYLIKKEKIRVSVFKELDKEEFLSDIKSELYTYNSNLM